MNKKPKILCVIPTLGAGGAERIISFLAQNICREKFDSHLLIIGKSNEAAYTFEKNTTTFLNKNRVLIGIPLIIAFLIKYRPNIVISSIGHLNTVFGILAPFFPSCKFIIREASVISIMSKFKKGKKIYGTLSKIAFKNVDMVVCQSQDMADDFIELHNLSPEKLTIINNPITEEFPVKNKSNTNKVIKFITVGRLSKEKGHARLLEVLATAQYPFQYTIIGTGPEEENIRQKITQLGLSKKINHIPFTKKIGQELSKHDVFLQGSYVEGFPNAILESCVVGTPVIAFNAPGGTKEIIEDGVNGFIVANKNEFKVKLETFCNIHWEPKIVRGTVINKFNKQKILNQYENLLFKLLNN